MRGGGPLYATHNIGLEIWYNAFMYLKFGYATAAAWIMGAMLVGFTLYQLRILRDVRFSAGASVRRPHSASQRLAGAESSRIGGYTRFALAASQPAVSYRKARLKAE